MRFHLPSFALGAAGVLVAGATRHRIRPVLVELTSLAVHFSRVSRAAIERKCEDVEDLWAEIEDRVNARARGRAPNNSAPHDGGRIHPPSPAAAKAH